MSGISAAAAGAECANASDAASMNASINPCTPKWDGCSVIPTGSIYFYPFRRYLLAPLLALALLGNIVVLVGVARVHGISHSTRIYYAMIAIAELVVAGMPFEADVLLMNNYCTLGGTISE